MLWLVVVVSLCVTSCQSELLFVATPHTRVVRDVEATTIPQQTVLGPTMTSLRVESDIFYRYAKTSVASKLANRADIAQEITFDAVLPQSAFISAFHIELEGKVYHAYVKEKEEANREYTEAVSQGRTAAKVDLSARDSNRFTVSVNVEAAAKVVFNLTYEELLTRRLGVYNHVINLDPGQIVPELSVIVRIEESNTLSTVRVPTLRLTNEISTSDKVADDPLAKIERPAPNKATIRWNPSTAEQLDLMVEGVKGQLTVEYDIDRTANPSQILVSEGYFVHFYSPADLTPLKKHVVFVLDISGSMWHMKLDQVKEAMTTILSDLQSGDYISIILFSSEVEIWLPSKNGTVDLNLQSEVEASPEVVVMVTSENIKLAKEFVANLQTAGATNINDALLASLEIVKLGRKVLKLPAAETAEANARQTPEPMIIFLTDGQANVGVSDSNAIVNGVTQRNKRKTPIFSLAFGNDADKTFLKKLSLKNAAFSRLIYEASDAALQLRDFYRQVASPLLANVTFNYEPAQVVNESLTNHYFNNLFRGGELVVAGKIEPTVDKLRGVLTAKSSSGKSRYGFPSPIFVTLPVPVNRTAPTFMEKLWAYLNIQQLLEEHEQDEAGVNSTSKEKALELALKYSFVTPLTSLVVVKPNATSRVNAEDAAKQPDSRPLMRLSGSMGGYPQPQAGSVGTRGYIGSSMRSKSGVSHRYSPPAAGSGLYGPPSGLLGLSGLPGLPQPSYPTQTYISGDSLLVAADELQEQTADQMIIDATVQDPISITMRVPAQPLTLNDLRWPVESNNGTHIMVNRNGKITSYEVDVNEPDTDNGACNLSSTSVGRCRHLAYCVQAAFQHDFNAYVTSYFCHIDSFAGVCCPDATLRSHDVKLHKIGG